MKLATKIWLVVALLVLVGVGIFGIGVSSIQHLSKIIDENGLAMQRVIALGDMRTASKDFAIAVRDLATAKTVEQMNPLFKKMAQQREIALNATKLYDEHLPSKDAASIAKMENYRKIFSHAMDVANTTLQPYLLNSSNEAQKKFEQQTPQWDVIEKQLSTVADMYYVEQAEDADRGRAANKEGDAAEAFDAMSESSRHLDLAYSAGLGRTLALRLRLDTSTLLLTDDAKVRAELIENMATNQKAAVQLMEKLQASTKSAEKKKLYGDVRQIFVDLGKSRSEIETLIQTDSNRVAQRRYRTEAQGLVADARIFADNLTDEENKFVEALETRSETLAHNSLMIALIGGGAGLLIGIIVAWLIIHKVNISLRRVINELEKASEEVKHASVQINSASQQLSLGATEQASSLSETSGSITSATETTQKNAATANKTSESNAQNNKLIATGSQAVEKMATAMGEINDSAEKIGKIIKTIEDIAFQTNLLALNAAVEAARAGEAGKGFAVVAEEVRNLAGRSAQAARDTTDLIESTVSRVRNGSEIANEVEKDFTQIRSVSEEVSGLIQEITAVTNEQAQSIGQINNSVTQANDITQQNAASAEESAAASEELSSQAMALHEIVGTLAEIVHGSKHNPESTYSENSTALVPLKKNRA